MFRRIFTGYLTVLIISFVVLALAFSFTVRQYLINDTVRSLYRVAETLSTGAIDHGVPGSGHMRGAFFNLANRIAYAEYVLIKPDGTILDSSDIGAYPPGAEMLNEAFLELAFGGEEGESMVERDRVAVSFPVVMGSGEKASLILYSQLDVLTQLNRSILGILAFAAGAGIVVSIIAGIFATRVVVGPLQQLKSRANELSRRQFNGKLAINTGDEVEELAETFNEMAGRLAEYDRSQKEFFQKASHELKTPLMSIQGYAEALKDGIILEEEKNQSLDIIIRESRRMKALVDEFIYLSKMETLNESYNFVQVNLEEAVKEAVDSVRSLALEKNIDLTVIAGGDDCKIKGDPEKIHRLLLNLLGNALNYARHKITVFVRGGQLIVSDDGPGFESKDLEKVFDPFFNNKSKTGGSGLGLAISKAIVEKHQGAIKVGNNPEGGARLEVDFY